MNYTRLLLIIVVGLILVKPIPVSAQKRIKPVRLPKTIFIDTGATSIKVEGVSSNWDILYVAQADADHYWVLIRRQNLSTPEQLTLPTNYALYYGTAEALKPKEILGEVELSDNWLFVPTIKGVLRFPRGNAMTSVWFGDKNLALIPNFSRQP